MALDKYVLYTACPDTDPGYWYRSFPSLRDAIRAAEGWLAPEDCPPVTVAIYQLVEVMKEEFPQPDG